MKSLRSPNLRKRRRIRIFVRTFFICSLLTLLIGIPIFLSRTSRLRINTIAVQGNSVISSTDIQKTVETELSGNFFYVFSKSNIFLYSKEIIKKNLYKTFSRIENIEISSKLPHTILISIHERDPKALWCKGEGLSECYFLDSSGFIFDRAPSFTQNVYFIYRGGLDGDVIGKQFLPSNLFQKGILFIERIRGAGLNPVSMSLMQNTEASVSLSGGGTILFSLQDDVEKSTSNLSSVLSDPSLSVVKNGVLTVLSIDLRFGNKVILKKKGD